MAFDVADVELLWLQRLVKTFEEAALLLAVSYCAVRHKGWSSHEDVYRNTQRAINYTFSRKIGRLHFSRCGEYLMDSSS